MIGKYSKLSFCERAGVTAEAAKTGSRGRRFYRALPCRLPVQTCNFFCLLLICMFSNQSVATDTPPEWCRSLLPPLEHNVEQGRLVISSQLVAHMRIGVPIDPVTITLTGIGEDMPVVTSSLQCSSAVVFDQLPPGQYRIVSIEGSLNILTAPNRFLYPLPEDGYRVIFTGGQTAIYRVPVPRKLSPIVEVTAGQTNFAGELRILPDPRRIWAIKTAWVHDLAARTGSCNRFNTLFDEQQSCD